ncbi:MAG: ATP-binding protein [Anaerocolumna sp.]
MANSSYKNKRLDGLKTLVILTLSSFIGYLFLHLTNSIINATLSYILGIMIVSKYTSGYLWSLLSSFAGLVGINIFLSYSHYSSSSSQNSYFTLMAILIISISVCVNKARLKNYTQKTLEREEYTKKTNKINSSLLSLNGVDTIANLAIDYVMEFTQTPVIFYQTSPQKGDPGIIKGSSIESERVFHSSHETFLAHWTFENKCSSGSGSTFGKSSSCTYFPLISHNQIWGVIGIYVLGQNPICESTLEYINIILSQVAIALERQHLSDSSQEIMIEREKEKTRANLLRAVSHDLRTPLTGMIGASDSLLNHHEKLNDSEKRQLLQFIYEDSNWLLHMVENLLSVTRIRESGTAVKKTPEPLEEVITEAVWRLRKRVAGTKITIDIPPELIIVPMDATLIEQVLLNLLENAVKYAGIENPINLKVTTDSTYVSFTVSDTGPGLPVERLQGIFDNISFKPNDSIDTSKGFGIGLSICKTIVNAHGGTITAKNNVDKGAQFQFTLPLEKITVEELALEELISEELVSEELTSNGFLLEQLTSEKLPTKGLPI